MTLEEYRNSYINDIKAEALSSSRHQVEVFIDEVKDMLINDFSLLSDLDECYLDNPKGTRAFKSMKIDGVYLDVITNTLNLLIADYNEFDIKVINNEFINQNAQLMQNFFENVLKNYFSSTEQSANYTQQAQSILRNLASINKLKLFIISTNKLSDRVKTINLPEFIYLGNAYKVELEIIDFNKIYNFKAEGFEKEDIIINCDDFDNKGIPCIKADINSDLYESYLAVVPGNFLSEIYKKYGPQLLTSNVRSFLNLRGAVNKGIRGTILNEPEKFFSYNNGISTTAKEIEIENTENGLVIKSFTDLQIINGGQTTASLTSASVRDSASLENIFVQMKLTLIKDVDEEFIRNISKYANSQNKVTAADLNSNHPYFARIEEFSRKIFSPTINNQAYQTQWFFERARGQYEQPTMKMTKAQKDHYQRINPKSQKFTKTDLAKYINSSERYPYDVSWGAETNALKFQIRMEKMWEKDNSFVNESYFKDLVAKAIIFKSIEKCISEESWYKENKGYRAQLVTYTFSKLVEEVLKINKLINYKSIWDRQEITDSMRFEISKISKIAFDTFYDPNRQYMNIGEYCKRDACWKILKDKPYKLSVEFINTLIDIEDKKIEEIRDKKQQKFSNAVTLEVELFNKGPKYWNELYTKGESQKILNHSEIQLFKMVERYSMGLVSSIPSFKLKEISKTLEKLEENGIAL